MIITPHILAGAVVGSRIHNYWLVAILSVAVHFLLDSIPHKEYDTDDLDSNRAGKGMIFDLIKVALDFAIGIGLSIYFGVFAGGYDLNYFLTGMFFGILPDFISYSRILFNFPEPKALTKFHDGLHLFSRKKYMPTWVKYGTQVMASLLFVWLLIK